MDLKMYIFAGSVAVMGLIAGLILLFVWHGLRMRQQNRMKSFLARDLIHKVKRVMVEGTVECMDIMPEKVTEAKRVLEER